MAFDKKAPDWKAEGIEPPLSKREIGWEVEDKPPAAWLNWYMNSTSESIQELQTKAVEKIYVDQEIIDAFGSIKDASLTEKGLVKLSNSLVSESETEAPTLKAIKRVNDNANLIGDAIEAVNERLDSEKYSLATINAGTQVIQGGATPSIAFPKMGGRTLINLLGDAGGCETLTGWTVETNVTLALATDVKDNGTYSIKATRTTSAGNMYVRSKLSRIDPTKHLLILAWVKNSGVASMGVRLVSSGGTGITGGKSNVVLTGESKIAYQALTPTALGANTDVYIDIYAGINFSVGEYANMDSVRVLQITAVEYAAIDSMTSDQLAVKYPFVGTGIHGVKDTTITSVQDNLLPPFSEWERLHTNALLISDYKLSHTRTGALIESSSAPNIPALPNTDYYLNSGGSLIKVYSSYNGFTYTPLIEISTEGSFKTLPDTKYLLIEAYVYTVGRFTWENPMLVKGIVAQPFKPQSKTVLTAYTELHSNTDGTIKDTLEYVSGKPKKLKRFGKIVLDGSLAWAYAASLSGYKMIALLGLPAGIGYLDLSVTKYDGRPLLPVGNATAADQTYLSIASSYKDLVLTISNADSGWGDAYTPTADEIKAYFNGWLMLHVETWNTSLAPYNGVGTKGWAKRYMGVTTPNIIPSSVGLIESGSGTQTLPITPIPSWTPYQLLYQLAKPTVEAVKTSGAVVLKSGDNHVTVTSTKVPILPGVITYADSVYTALADLEKALEPFMDKRLASTVVGNVFTQQQFMSAGNNSLILTAGDADHVYLSMNPRTADPGKRGMWLGYGDKGLNTLVLMNELGDLDLKVPFQRDVTVNGERAWHTGNNPASLAPNGYQKLASGLIIQWGVLEVPVGGLTITFPIAFPAEILHVNGMALDNEVAVVTYTGLTLASVGLKHHVLTGPRKITWFALGR